MRTIEFRGKAFDNGEWVYGSLIQRIGHFPTIVEEFASNGKLVYRQVAVTKDSVGQFTGLYDKNGKEIYEGDIVSITLHHNNSCESSYNAVVKQTDGAFGFGNVNGFAPFYGRGKSEIEVIGNIHNNPELMKGGEE